MSVNYDLNNTGPEVQERLDQVFPNRDSISEEEAARQQRDNEIIDQMKAYTDAEQTRAEGAEQGLQAAIDAEQSRAKGIEQSLYNAVDAETERAQSAERGLRNYTDTEKERAEGVEDSHGERLDSLENIVGGGGDIDTRIANAVNTERQRATAVEATKADKKDTYTKTEVDSLITTPDQQYVTVGSYSELPDTGAANTIYRVANWDGTQFDSTKYAEYAWTGSVYQLLSVKDSSNDYKKMLWDDTTVIISPNVLNVWANNVSELNVTFAGDNVNKAYEYMLEFTASGDEFSLNLPSGVRWSNEPEWEDGYTYQVSIVDGLAIAAEWEAAGS